MTPPSKKSQTKKVSKCISGNVQIPYKKPIKCKEKGRGSSLSRKELNKVRPAVVDVKFEAEERLLKKRKRQNKVQKKKESRKHHLDYPTSDGTSRKLHGVINKAILKDSCCSDATNVEVEPRVSIPPLDDTENSDVVNMANQDSDHASYADTSDEEDKKRTIKKAKRLREQEISAAEERLVEKDIPRNEDEFEKLVRSSPNSSFVWIKYMEFMLSVADVEKARFIAERALRTINITEEFEKLNVWIAYFNLENEYGDHPEEAVAKVFQRALQYCDPKKVHLALLGMYERTEQHNLADELLNKMAKKFKHSCKVWLRQAQWILKQRQESFQSVVNRALLSLPSNKHIKFIKHTAILEFKCGVPDRGRSLFEKMLREYPKRTDLWSVYIDQEIRLGDVDVIRALFERAITLRLPPKKMKFLFQKYLEYEKTLGYEERIESVKRKAMEYVESTVA